MLPHGSDRAGSDPIAESVGRGGRRHRFGCSHALRTDLLRLAISITIWRRRRLFAAGEGPGRAPPNRRFYCLASSPWRAAGTTKTANPIYMIASAILNRSSAA